MERRRRLYYATEDEVLAGEVTDIYFKRAKEVLEAAGASGRVVSAEVHAYSLPSGYEWVILAGVEEVAKLLEGRPVNVYSMHEGELFRPMEPVMRIEGSYASFGIYESALLGVLRHESSVATKAALLKLAAGDKPVVFFGIRCVHPSIAPAIDRAAFIGGCDAVSGVLGASLIGERPMGTMPHALIIVIGDQRRAWKAFDEVVPKEVPRITLCDTWSDERAEALMAAETLRERLYGVRLDTPSSRRGNMKKIVEEVRWTLDVNGWRDVKIFVSGGVDVEELEELKGVADGFGIGTSIAFPPSIDLALDVVEVEGRPISKRGKLPGAKQVYRCPNLHDSITLDERKVERCPKCGEGVEALLKPLVINGEIVAELPPAKEIRSRVLSRLAEVKRAGKLEPPLLLS